MASSYRGGAPEEVPAIGEFLERIDGQAFERWYLERQFRRNIEQGRPYFNGPSQVPTPERHSPNALLQCHRRRYYSQLNAPQERRQPHGILWFGTHFEEQIAVEFLRDCLDDTGSYVRNDFWVDFEVETDVGPLRIKGVTDPVVVDSESTPLLLTEIKTKSSIESLDAPDEHHLAQAHAYLYGLSEQYESITDAVILYADRETFETRLFHVEFDPDFWDTTVLAWATQHTTYRLDEELPPAEPRYEWECSYCDYANRCGRGDTEYPGDYEPVGFLPGFRYPRQDVIDHLDAHDNAKLTPTLAAIYPDLADRTEIRDWQCEACSSSFPFAKVDWNEDARPQCPVCKARGVPATLIVPLPETGENDDN